MRHRCGRVALVISSMLVAACGDGASFAGPPTTAYAARPTTTTTTASGPQRIVIDRNLNLCGQFSLDEIKAATSLAVTTSAKIDKNGLGCTWSVRPVATGEALELVRIVLVSNLPTVVNFNKSSANFELVPDLGDRTVIVIDNDPVESPFYKMVLGVTRGTVFMGVECVRLGQPTTDPAVKLTYERQTLTTCARPIAQLVLSRL